MIATSGPPEVALGVAVRQRDWLIVRLATRLCELGLAADPRIAGLRGISVYDVAKEERREFAPSRPRALTLDEAVRVVEAVYGPHQDWGR